MDTETTDLLSVTLNPAVTFVGFVGAADVEGINVLVLFRALLDSSNLQTELMCWWSVGTRDFLGEGCY